MKIANVNNYISCNVSRKSKKNVTTLLTVNVFIVKMAVTSNIMYDFITLCIVFLSKYN